MLWCQVEGGWVEGGALVWRPAAGGWRRPRLVEGWRRRLRWGTALTSIVERVGALVLADPKVDNNRVAAAEGGDG